MAKLQRAVAEAAVQDEPRISKQDCTGILKSQFRQDFTSSIKIRVSPGLRKDYRRSTIPR